MEKMESCEVGEIKTLHRVEEVLDNSVSFRYVLYQRESFFRTEKIIKRGPWCPSISLSKQTAEVKIKNICINKIL